MFRNKKVVVVMPAYNAARTLQQTYDEVMAQEIVDLVIVVDDASQDETVAVARTLPNTMVQVHPANQGYGANQKTCYRLALEAGADIVIMVHPDYQYTPRLIPGHGGHDRRGLYPCVLGSRILGGYALQGGMPWWKYVSNRFLTFAENLLLGAKLSEYHTGYRAFSRRTAGTVVAGGVLRQLRLRQPDARPDPLAGGDDRRGELPHAVRAGILVDQPRAEHGLRVGLPGDGTAFSLGQDAVVRPVPFPPREGEKLEWLTGPKNLCQLLDKKLRQDRLSLSPVANGAVEPKKRLAALGALSLCSGAFRREEPEIWSYSKAALRFRESALPFRPDLRQRVRHHNRV